MECKNLIESGALDLDVGCPVCGCKKFQYVRPKKGSKKEHKPTVTEYVDQVKAEEKPDVAEATVTDTADVLPVLEQEKAEEMPVQSFESIIDMVTERKKIDLDRIESVRILDRGMYDINLPMLLNRKELVMSREEGSYIVDLPSALKPGKKKSN